MRSSAGAQALIGSDVDGQIEPTPDGFRVIECGRPFSRAIAARYLTKAGYLALCRWVMDKLA